MKSTSLVSNGQRASKRHGIIASILTALCLTAPAAFAATPGQVLREGPVYSPVPGIASSQAQIIIFRKAAAATMPAAAAAEPAHVYINSHFHTALLPNGYTRFCLNQGIYTIQAPIGDAPVYASKANPDPKRLVSLEGGKTYFAAVSEDGKGEAVLVDRADAERLLASAREPHHVISRVPERVACNEVAAPAQPAKFTLNGDVLFEFDRGDYGSITSAGRTELQKVVGFINEQSAGAATRVGVRGHADPMGGAAHNQKLSEQRAQSIARVLKEQGIASDRIHADGVGSTMPVVNCPKGAKAEKIACNAPNRRVEVTVEGMKK
ncbi:OmpA family protein [Variovorax sp. J22R133]|uniref:OmpA family protein n=1 Tax=Variovorax brevis TaxID=3053503 RepID=UPI002578FC46|nr:OmpA family protein [Variovorax sp. J22R133]MDM0115512.1 OmpA family protein [Variovorax sp. J22R133]